jgi:predicted ATPase
MSHRRWAVRPTGHTRPAADNELQNTLVPQRGLFAAGEFDKRDIPYSTLAQAFRSLVRLLLAESEPELGVWRKAFLEVLGPNAQLMVDVISELKSSSAFRLPSPNFHLWMRKGVSRCPALRYNEPLRQVG